MIKILIVNGNPDLKDRQFKYDLDELKNMLKTTGNNVCEMTLCEMKLNQCIGCFSCWVKTPGICIFKDDGPKILKEYMKSDTVIFASPVISGLFSTLLQRCYERLLPLEHPYIHIKKGVCHHMIRYEKYPATCLVLGRNDDYGPEFTEIIDSICKIEKVFAKEYLFTKVLENNLQEIADEINCI